MKVKELIRRLQQEDPNTDVMIRNGDEKDFLRLVSHSSIQYPAMGYNVKTVVVLE